MRRASQTPYLKPKGVPGPPSTPDDALRCFEAHATPCARFSGREARHVGDAAICHPDPVLLVDAKVEWRPERLARVRTGALANDPTRAQIALGKVEELALLDAQDPNVSAGRDDDPYISPPDHILPSAPPSTYLAPLRRGWVEGRKRVAFDPSLVFRQPRPNDRDWPKAEWQLWSKREWEAAVHTA